MKRLLLKLQKFSDSKIFILCLLMLLQASISIGQSCAELVTLRKIPAVNIVCQGSVTSDFLNNYNASNGYSFTAITGALPSIGGARPVVTFNWTTAGNYYFVMRETPPIGSCTPDTFRVHVVPSAAPQINCNDTVNVSLDEFCLASIRPSMVLEGTFDSLDYDVIIKDPLTGLVIPSSPNVNSSYKGRFLEVTVKHKCSTNSCWGVLRIEDKLGPILSCGRDTVNCGAIITPEALGFPKPSPAAPNPTPVAGQPQKYTVNSTFYDNCGMVTLMYTDVTIHVSCPPAVLYIDTVFRNWVATDMFGTITKCQDTILIRAATLDSVMCPRNYDGLDPDGAGPLTVNPAPLQCNGGFAVDNNGNPHPSVTGIPSRATCRNINYSYTDIKLRACDKSYKIIREWLIIDWCTGLSKTCNQIIKVVDDQGPALTCNVDITVSTLANSCTGEVNIPLPTFFNECSATVTWQVYVIRSAPRCTRPFPSDRALEDASGITLNPGGTSYRVVNLPVGCSWVRFYGTDGCGNTTMCATEVKVEERVKPIAICDLRTNVTLTTSGSAKVFASSFDDGSHDNCELADAPFQVRRMTAASCPSPVVSDTLFRDFVEFCCADVATNPNIVVLRVFDKAGNYNECMVEVRVVDKQAPIRVACPPDITVSCGFDRSNLSVFGTVRSVESERRAITLNDPRNTVNTPQPRTWGYDGLITDDCNITIRELTPNNGINSCGVGTITRSWVASDNAGNSVSCSQTITVRDYTPFTGVISWPRTYEGEGCSASVDTSVTGAPRWSAGACSNVIASYEDEVYNIVENVCYKIIRKWAVIDWCTYNSATNTPIYRYSQIIKIKNSVAPTITSSCANKTVLSPTTDCSGYIELIATATDDCPAPNPLTWTYKIDLGNDGSVDYSGNTNDASGTYPHGTHKITWTVQDNCNNQTSCVYLFTIRDGKKPTPVCRPGVITVVMPSSNQVVVWASDLNYGSYDNCTPSNLLTYTFESGSTSRTFTCSDIPDGRSATLRNVKIIVTDSDGNTDFCTTEITLQDGAGNICPDRIIGGGGTTAIIAGSISNETNSMMENATLAITGNMAGLPKTYLTLNDGKYAFASLAMNEDYKIAASKNDDPLNGVSTQDILMIQKHILGVQNLSSAYKVIAADVNNSESISARDIADIRKLILGVTSEFPNKKSWRFVNSAQKFNDIFSPWPIQESVEISQLDHDMMDNNFVAVKVGDVSGNAKTNQFGNAATRTNDKLIINIENKKFAANQIIEMPVMIQHTATLSGMQLEFNWDPTELVFESITSNELDLSSDQVSLINVNKGSIRIAWDDIHGVVISNILFTLKMKALKYGSTSNSISLNESNMLAEAYNNDGKALSLRLNHVNEDGKDIGNYFLYQNTPNPFDQSTNISFVLAKSEQALLTVYDVNGVILKTYNNVFKQGLNSIEITKQDLPQTGILYYSLETETFRSVRKMILID